MRTRALLISAVLVGAGLSAVPTTAHAESRVSVTNDRGTSKADPTYATTVTVRGSGFQSITGGSGGIYVFFGSTQGQWRPSKGGQTGRNYLYVPDSESRNNQGFQKFVAFPGGDTASSANGGTLKADGTWSTTMVIPGATFNAVDRGGKATKVDCLEDTCGFITIGAHGVKNARNETFTPVSFADLYGGRAPAAAAASAAPTAAPTGAAPTATAQAPAAPVGRPTLDVDRDTAVAGRVLTFNATGLAPGDQVLVSLDDGLAAVGPLSVGPNGQVAGSMPLPADLAAGTHVLKLTGSADSPTVSFPVRAEIDPASASTDAVPWLAIVFAGLGGVALVGALVFSAVRLRRIRRRKVDVATTGAAHA